MPIMLTGSRWDDKARPHAGVAPRIDSLHQTARGKVMIMRIRLNNSLRKQKGMGR